MKSEKSWVCFAHTIAIAIADVISNMPDIGKQRTKSKDLVGSLKLCRQCKQHSIVSCSDEGGLAKGLGPDKRDTLNQIAFCHMRVAEAVPHSIQHITYMLAS